VINSDSLFDEQVLVKKHMSECCKEESWQNASLEQKWVAMFKEFEKKRIRVSNFQKLVEFIFCLPRTSAPVERIFSIMKSMWSESRSRMLEQNVKAVITCKINTDWSCSDFYKNVKLNNDFLKVLSTEKYDWANKQILFYYSFFRLLHRKNRNSIYFASLTSIPFYFSN